MPETAHGIVYPDASAHTRLWEHFQELAETADAALPEVPLIQFGLATVGPISAAGYADGAVVFPKPFATAPVVVAVGNYWGVSVTPAAAPTPTAVTLRAFNGRAAAIAGVVSAYWIAIAAQ